MYSRFWILWLVKYLTKIKVWSDDAYLVTVWYKVLYKSHFEPYRWNCNSEKTSIKLLCKWAFLQDSVEWSTKLSSKSTHSECLCFSSITFFELDMWWFSLLFFWYLILSFNYRESYVSEFMWQWMSFLYVWASTR